MEILTNNEFEALKAAADMADELAEELRETHAALCMRDVEYLGSLRYKRNRAIIEKHDTLKEGE